MYENGASGVYQPQIQKQNMTEQATEEMGRYIWKILLSGGPITMSWGIDTNTLKKIDNGISFHVQGLKHKGTIEIIYDDGTNYFIVNLVRDDNPENKETLESIAFDELVRVIDEKVEYTGSDYTERIREEYGFSKM